MILLTGVTGNVGGATASELNKKGVRFRAIVRSPDKVKADISMQNEIIPGDLADVSVMKEALQGVDRMLLVTPNSEQQAMLEKSVVDLAANSGVQQIVKISSIEASPSVEAPVAKLHYQIEQHIKSAVPYGAFLRATFYYQTLFTMAQPVKTANVLPLPLGDTRICMMDVRDLAKAAAKMLSDEAYCSGEYPISGVGPMSLAEVAATMSSVLGREIKYADMPDEAYRETLDNVLDDKWRVNAICTLFLEIKAGALDQDFPNISALTGEEAISLEQFLQDHKHVFNP